MRAPIGNIGTKIWIEWKRNIISNNEIITLIKLKLVEKYKSNKLNEEINYQSNDLSHPYVYSSDILKLFDNRKLICYWQTVCSDNITFEY